MKLSEILKEDWPEKEELNLVSPSDYDMSQLADDTHKYIRDLEILTEKQDTSLTSCDREIDREVLVTIIKQAVNNKDISDEISFADEIISTMPKWLKRIEGK